MQHTCAGGGDVVEPEGAAPNIIRERHMTAVVVAVCPAMVRVGFHLKYDRVIQKVMKMLPELRMVPLFFYFSEKFTQFKHLLEKLPYLYNTINWGRSEIQFDYVPN